MRLDHPNIIHMNLTEICSLCEHTPCGNILTCSECPWFAGGNPTNRVVKIIIRDTQEQPIVVHRTAPYIVDISKEQIKEYCMTCMRCDQLGIPNTRECDRVCPVNTYTNSHDGRELYIVIDE